MGSQARSHLNAKDPTLEQVLIGADGAAGEDAAGTEPQLGEQDHEDRGNEELGLPGEL